MKILFLSIMLLIFSGCVYRIAYTSSNMNTITMMERTRNIITEDGMNYMLVAEINNKITEDIEMPIKVQVFDPHKGISESDITIKLTRNGNGPSIQIITAEDDVWLGGYPLK